MNFEDEDEEAPELRTAPREPTEDRDKRCDGCKDIARFVCEVPRSRKVGTKEVEMPPARFRLCTHHATKLLASDQSSSAYAIKESASE